MLLILSISNIKAHEISYLTFKLQIYIRLPGEHIQMLLQQKHNRVTICLIFIPSHVYVINPTPISCQNTNNPVSGFGYIVPTKGGNILLKFSIVKISVSLLVY